MGCIQSKKGPKLELIRYTWSQQMVAECDDCGDCMIGDSYCLSRDNNIDRKIVCSECVKEYPVKYECYFQYTGGAKVVTVTYYSIDGVRRVDNSGVSETRRLAARAYLAKGKL